jgi:hypothetical protein
MPTEQVTLSLPANVRNQIFQSMGAETSLMSDLNIDNWERVLNQLREASGTPATIEISRGGFSVERRVSVYNANTGTVNIEFAKFSEAERIVSIASDGKMKLEKKSVDEGSTGLPTRFIIVPSHAVDAAGFAAYTMGSDFRLTYSDGEENEPSVTLNDLRTSMASYLDYSRNRGTYVRNVIRQRMVGNPNYTPKKEMTADQKQKANESLFNFLEKTKKRTKPAESPFKKIQILPHKTVASRRWGIEIEAVDIAEIETPLHWELHGDGSLRTQGRYATESTQHLETCTSMTVRYGACNCDYEVRRANDDALARMVTGREQLTGEWNSPILHSFHSRGLKHLSDSLEGRYTNSSAGVHVHVEAADLTPQQAVNLTMIYTALEPLFEGEYHRAVRNYCKSVDLSELVSRLDTARTLKGQKATAYRSGRRYYTVNMAALASHGTIEFRAMGNIYEYEHLIRWAHFCRELVNIAKANVPQKAWSRVSTFEDLIVLFSKYGKETPTPDWAPDAVVDFEPLVKKLGIENRRLPNARPSNAYTSGGGTAPVELFDDYSTEKVVTRGLVRSSY